MSPRMATVHHLSYPAVGRLEHQPQLQNRLNQDCVENLFSVLRGKGGHRYNPDCREFKAAFRQTIVDSILVAGERKNCQEDLDSFLFSFENIASLSTPSVVKSRLQLDVPRSIQPILSGQNPMPSLNVQEVNILVYIAGYVAKKLAPIVCESCQPCLVRSRNLYDTEQIFLNEKQFSHIFSGGLTAPSHALQKMLETAEKMFRDSISSLMITSGIRFKLLKRMVEATSRTALRCPLGICDTTFLALNLYTNVRLHFHIKCLNRGESGASQRLRIKKKSTAFRHQ